MSKIACIEGDSISAYSEYSWPGLLRQVGFADTHVIENLALSSDTAANIDAGFSSGAGALDNGGGIFVCMSGTNDLAGGATDTNVIASKASIAAKAAAAGYETVVDFEILPSAALTGQEETYRRSVNSAMETDPNVDIWVPTPTTLNDPSDTIAYIDGVHPHVYGATSLAGMIEAAVNGYPENKNCGYSGVSPNNCGADALHAFGFVTTENSYSSKIRINCGGNGNAWLAIYDGTSTGPTNRKASLLEPVALTTGWNDVVLSGVPLIAGNWYYVSVITDVLILTRAADNSSQGGKIISNYSAYSGFSFPQVFPTPDFTFAQDAAVEIYGYSIPEQPTLATVSNDAVVVGDSVVATGTNFMGASDPIKIWIADGPVFATATKAEQTLDAQSDTEVTFDMVSSSVAGVSYLFVETSLRQLSNYLSVNVGRTNYIFVTNSAGVRNAVGFPVTLFE